MTQIIIEHLKFFKALNKMFKEKDPVKRRFYLNEYSKLLIEESRQLADEIIESKRNRK